MSEVDPEAEGRIGEVLDSRYRLLKVLGTGGMGTVYEAEHVVLKRPRAIKILHPSLATTRGMAQRFEREAIAAGRLRDPHCVEVSDFGKLPDGTLYLAMELVRGPTLREVLEQSGQLPLARAVEVLRQMLRALEHAHSLEIVHRDVKPENVIVLERDGEPLVKLLDFGIAKLIGSEAEGQEQLTATGFAVGTPRYLAPEQALGVPLDGRVDLYAATVVFFELVAGRTPFEGEGVQLVTQHLTAEPPALSRIARQPVGPALDALVRRGLAKAPSDRFASASEYRAALEACALPGPPVHTPEAFSATALVSTPVPPGLATPVPAAAPPPGLATPVPAAAPPPGLATPVPASAPPSGYATPVPAAASSMPGLSLAPSRRRRLIKIAAIATAALLAIGIIAEMVGPSHEERVKAVIERLNEGATCEERRDAVRTLAAIGDPRALPALRRARQRRRGGVIGIGDRNTNACLQDDAAAAIEKLERMPPR